MRKGESIGIFFDDVGQETGFCKGSTWPVSTDFEAETVPQHKAERDRDEAIIERENPHHHAHGNEPT